jgi:orotate phosphoribosyltransferase
MEDYAKRIALAGLEIKAIKLNAENPFQWASGYRMPIYNDNRMFMYYPEHRELITKGFQQLIEEEKIPAEVVAGTSTSGIPWGMLLADGLNLPFIYVRDKPKEHGLRNQIEGIDSDKDLEGKITPVIEDLISTGGSSARTVKAVRDANGRSDYCLSIFSYGFPEADAAFAQITPGCKVRSILTYPTLLEVAREQKYLGHGQFELLSEWSRSPFTWGAEHGFPRVGGN